jgi:periplasmic protein TonB
MSYVDQGVMTQGRLWSIVLVAILHALLGYAFVTGLAYKFVKTVQEDLKTFDVEEPPPPEEEPPPPPEQVDLPPPPTAPPPIVRTQISTPTIIAPPPPPVVIRPPVITPPAPPPPPPPPPRTVEPARARTNLASYVSNDDYPASALRNEEEGTTRFRLTVGSNGRVTDCSVTSSSGSAALDSATCRIMRARARFTPARDNQGNPTTDSYSSSITWRIQD